MWLQVNPKNSVRGMFFLPHKVLQHFIHFHIHDRVKPKSSEVVDMGDVCIYMPCENDSPPISWGEWIGGAPVSNVHFVSQAMQLIPPFFH